jgi:AAHS family 4-hydroxybenzoate transporter-like MFS transporter
LIDRSPVSPYQVFVVFLGALVLFIDGLDVQLISYVGPKILTEWGISRTVLGTIFSSAVWGLLIGFAFVAPLSVRYGHRTLILANMLLFGLATMANSLVHEPATMMALRIVTGIGIGGVIPSGVALTGECMPKRRRSTAIALIYCGYSIGTVSAGLLAGLLVESHGWRTFMVVGGLIPIAIAAFLYFTLPESPEYLVARGAPRDTVVRLLARLVPSARIDPQATFAIEARATSSPVAQLFQNGRTLGTLMLWVALFMNLMVVFFVLQWLPSILRMVGYTPAAATHAATWATSGGILAALILGPLMDRLGPSRVIMALFVIGGVFLFLTGATAHSTALLVTAMAFIATGSVSGIQKCINALMVFFYPTALRSTGLGWAFGVGRFGAILGPILAGFLFDRKWPVEDVFDIYAIPMLIGAAAIAILYFRYGRVNSDTAARSSPPGSAAG